MPTCSRYSTASGVCITVWTTMHGAAKRSAGWLTSLACLLVAPEAVQLGRLGCWSGRLESWGYI